MATTEKGIYYPNDYSSVADVPEDFKKLAESVNTAIEDLDTNKVDKVDGKGLSTNDFTNEDKAKLDSLENYDDIEIKQDIEDIQEEQAKQNEDIEDLKQINAKQDDLIQKLKDNSINVTTEEATSLHVTDASTLPAKLDVRGNHSQKTREGYNELKITEGNQTYYGVTMTVNNDGSVKFNGTATATTGGFLLTGSTNYSVDDFPYGEQLTFSCEGLVEGLELAIAEADSSGAWLRNIVVLNSINPKQQITPTKGENAVYIRVAYTVTNGKTFNNIITYPMFYKGTENKSFEQYGASPSIDYPSTVHAVGDNVNIFDKDNVNKILATPSNLTMIASKLGGASFYLEIKPNTNYSISRKIVGSRFLAATSVEVPTVGVSLTQNVPNNNGDEINITTGENDNYLLVYYLYNNSENEEEILSSIKIEEGTEATTYSPYGQGSVEVKKINKNFYKLDIEGVSRSGVDYTTRNGTVTAKRTATAESGSYFNTNRTKLPAGTYVISGVDDTFVYANARIEVYTSDTIDGNATQITTLMNTRLSYKYTSDKPFYLSFSFVVTGETDVNDTFIFKPQAEKNVATDFEEHKEQSLVLDIQKPMLQGDYFVKEADGWKEVHTFGYVNTREVENLGVSLNTSNGEFRRYNAHNLVTDRKSGEYLKILCTHFKRIDSRWHENEGICGWETGQSFCIGTFNTNYDTVDKMKTFLQNNDVGIYYELATPTKLPCTEEQSAILDQLNNLELYKGTNNIITAESLALMQMQYIADTETYIDNRIDEKLTNINQQILNIVGGN